MPAPGMPRAVLAVHPCNYFDGFERSGSFGGTWRLGYKEGHKWLHLPAQWDPPPQLPPLYTPQRGVQRRHLTPQPIPFAHPRFNTLK